MFSIRREDLPDPRPPRFNWHRHLSLLQLPPPKVEAQDLSYQPNRDRKYKWDRELMKRANKADNVLATLDYSPIPRAPGERTCVYGRVSASMKSLTDGDFRVERASTSLETQDAVATSWFNANRERIGLPPLCERMFADKDRSRKTVFARRPEAYMLLRYLRKGDHLIFAAFDRIGCNTMDICGTLKYLFRRGVTCHIIGFPMRETFDPNDPLSEFLVSTLALASRMEVENTSIRRKNATMTAKRSGKWNGNSVPYGFHQVTVDGTQTTIANKEEQEVLNECYRCWLAGWSVYELRLVLNRKNVMRLGKHWNNDQLFKAIKKMHDERKRLGVGA